MVADSQGSDCKKPAEGLDKVNATYDFSDNDLDNASHFKLLPDDNCHNKEPENVSNKYDKIFENQIEHNVLNASFIKDKNDKKHIHEHSSSNLQGKIEDATKMTPSTSSESYQGNDLRNKRKSPSKTRRAMGPNKKNCFKLPSKSITKTAIESKSTPNISISSGEDLSERSSSSTSRFGDIEDNLESSSSVLEDSMERSIESPNNSSDESKRQKESDSSTESVLADVEDNTESSSSISSEELKNELDKCIDSMSKPIENLNVRSINTTVVEVPTHKIDPQIFNPTSTTDAKFHSLKESILTNSHKMRTDVARNKKRRCFMCKKKLDLTAVACRCGGVFCPRHRYDTEHACTFDYKAMGVEQLRKDNPQVVAQKVSRL